MLCKEYKEDLAAKDTRSSVIYLILHWQNRKKEGSLEGHKEWVAYLLCEYYDPMYDYQIEKNRSRVLFRGSAREVEQYLEQYCQT